MLELIFHEPQGKGIERNFIYEAASKVSVLFLRPPKTSSFVVWMTDETIPFVVLDTVATPSEIGIGSL